MTFQQWYENHFVAGNIRSSYEPMFLHDRDKIVAQEAWDAALRYANERQAKTSERVMRPFEPGLD
jgi:hypothetical protein